MQKTCKQCGVIYYGLEVRAFFRQKYRKLDNSRCLKSSRPICIGCEISSRTERKRRNRPKEKARRTMQAHCDKHNRVNKQELTRKQFLNRFGWNLDNMAHDIDHAYKNGCPHCRESYKEMAHGLSDLTLDIIDRDRPPYYATNTMWICGTCNRAKGKTPPELWGAKLQAWKRWKKQQENLKINPFAGLPLFDYGASIGVNA